MFPIWPGYYLHIRIIKTYIWVTPIHASMLQATAKPVQDHLRKMPHISVFEV